MKIEDIIDVDELINSVQPEVYKYAMDMYKDIERYSFFTLEEFYRDYSPMYYHRLGQMPRIWEKPVIKRTKTGYEIIFTYSMDGLSLRHEEPHDYWIFAGPFEQGYHGGPIFTADSYKPNSRGRLVVDDYHYEPAPQMLPSPWDRILRYAEVKYNVEEI